MTTITINITKEILYESMYCGTVGQESNDISKNCAIAVAVRGIFPNADVGHCAIHFHMGDASKPMINIALPQEAQTFIDVFDAMKTVPEARIHIPEFSFNINVPDSIINTIGIEEVYEVLKNSETMSLVTA